MEEEDPSDVDSIMISVLDLSRRVNLTQPKHSCNLMLFLHLILSKALEAQTKSAVTKLLHRSLNMRIYGMIDQWRRKPQSSKHTLRISRAFFHLSEFEQVS